MFVYSAIPDALVNIFIQNGKGETVTETKSFKNGILEYETVIPKDESISRINLQFQLVAFNDVKTKSVDLKIAESKDDLKIETVTFRDKLQPAQKEKWTIKISGADKEKSMLKFWQICMINRLTNLRLILELAEVLCSILSNFL